MALASTIPEEGGLYVWTKRAFGERHGFMAGWLYWANNILYFPTLTLSTVVYALYIFGLKSAHLEKSAAYTAGAALVLLGIALIFNLVGMKTGRWVQNIGGIAQWIPSAALCSSARRSTRFGSATPLPAASLVPDFSALPTILFFANLCFGFAGLELAPVMAGEVVEPRRTFPRAVVISGLTIARATSSARSRFSGRSRPPRPPSSRESTRPSRRPEPASVCPGSDRRRRCS